MGPRGLIADLAGREVAVGDDEAWGGSARDLGRRVFDTLRAAFGDVVQGRPGAWEAPVHIKARPHEGAVVLPLPVLVDDFDRVDRHCTVPHFAVGGR